MLVTNEIKTQTSTVEDTALTAEITENVDNVIDYSVESTAKRIQPYMTNISNDKLKIGNEINEFKNAHNNNDVKMTALRKKIGLGREQFRKIQVVEEYCRTTSPNCHTCGNYEKLGFEKIYRISTLKKKNSYVDFENFAIEKDLSVRTLEKIVKKLNQNKQLTIEEAYELAIKETDENNQSQKQETNQNTDEKNIEELKKTLEEKEIEIKELKQSNDAKDKKIKELEERNKQLEQELKEHKLLLQTQEEAVNSESDENNERSDSNIVELSNVDNSQNLVSSC